MDTSINDTFLARIESLGDNCELGFVMRNSKYEKGGLFRWAITPIDKLINFIEDPHTEFYRENDLSPFSPGMVVDNQSGFSFHSKMISEKNSDGELNFKLTKSECAEIYDKEKSKIEYLRSGFIRRLQSDVGSIYLIKANKSIDANSVVKLAKLLKSYSSKHVLVEVKSDVEHSGEGRLEDKGTHYVANIRQFAPYIAANKVDYDEWDDILNSLKSNQAITDTIG